MSAPVRAAIVVTNYNYERHVVDAVESALAIDGVEVIVVDDGSTDDSLQRLAPYAERITLVATSNGGQGSAFNHGFAAVTAPVVLFLDADDVLYPDVVDRVAVEFGEPSVGRVQFPLDVIDAEGVPTGDSVPPAGVRLARGDLRRALTRFPSDIVWQPTSGNAFRTSALRRILPMPTAPFRICADYYLSNLSAAHGDVAVLALAGGAYRVHDTNSHYREQWTLEAIRQNVVRTSETHRLLIEHCAAVGLTGLPDDPDEVRSVTALAHRAISLRLDPARHPVGRDTRRGLAVRGVRAALGRFDVTPWRRAAMAGWFVVAALAPTALVRAVARPVLRVERVRPATTDDR